MSQLKSDSEDNSFQSKDIVMKQNGISICINEVDNNSNSLTMRQEVKDKSGASTVTPCDLLCEKLGDIKMSCENDSTDESSMAKVLNGTKDKKRIKHLVRAEAVRETSLSPPPDNISSELSQGTVNGSFAGTSHLTVYPNNFSNGKNSPNKMPSQPNSDASSPSLSRGSSTENSNDYSGQDLQVFFSDTMKKSLKDRVFITRIEQEMINLISDSNQLSHRVFSQSSYNRMLVHRLAAYFVLDHVVDSSHSSVIVSKNEKSRIPEIMLKDLFKEDETTKEPKKLILKRDSTSLEESSGSSFEKDKSPDLKINGSLSDSSRSRSLEEREEHYERVRARIFNQDSQTSNGEPNSSVDKTDNQMTPAQTVTLSSLESENPQCCDTILESVIDLSETKPEKDNVSPKPKDFSPTTTSFKLAINNSNSTQNPKEKNFNFKPYVTNNSNNQFKRNQSNKNYNNRNIHREANKSMSMNFGNGGQMMARFPPKSDYLSCQHACYSPYFYPNDQLNQQPPILMNPVLQNIPSQMNVPNPMMLQSTNNGLCGALPSAATNFSMTNMNYQYPQNIGNQQLYCSNEMAPYYSPINAPQLNPSQFVSYAGGYRPMSSLPGGMDQMQPLMAQPMHNQRNSGVADKVYLKNQGNQRRPLLPSHSVGPLEQFDGLMNDYYSYPVPLMPNAVNGMYRYNNSNYPTNPIYNPKIWNLNGSYTNNAYGRLSNNIRNSNRNQRNNKRS